MHRRSFLKNSTVAGLSVAATASLTACATGSSDESSDAKNYEAEPFALNEITIEVAQQQMAAGTLTAVGLTQQYIDRIAAIDKAGPMLNAVIEMNPDAIKIAENMDAERKAGKIRSSLHGIPVLIKDNIDTADKMQTTAGALALSGNIAKKDAFIIGKLREAGAVLLGKTNLSEWANFRSSSSSSGWSSRGGQTKCPYVLTHNPCGSSAGTGSAVAANLCVIGIGTETDGSVTCPSSVNGLVGLKPTVGLWSRSGIIPISATQDTAGPMGRTVKDVATMLGLLTGIDDTDPVTKESTGKTMPDYTAGLSAGSLLGKKIGVDLKKRSAHYQINDLLDQALEELKKQGAEIVDVSYVDDINALGDAELTILQYEFKNGINKYLANSAATVKDLAGVIAYNKQNEKEAMPLFKQDQLENCEAKGDLNSKEYLEALTKGRDGSRKILNSLMEKHKLDAFAGITMGPGCSIDMLYGDRYSGDFLTAPAAMSGYPHITVPAGKMFGLPVGFSLFGAAYSEAKLLNMAYAYEQATKNRVAPSFLKSMPV